MAAVVRKLLAIQQDVFLQVFVHIPLANIGIQLCSAKTLRAPTQMDYGRLPPLSTTRRPQLYGVMDVSIGQRMQGHR